MELEQTQRLARRQRYGRELLGLSEPELEAYVRELSLDNPVVELEDSPPPSPAPEQTDRLGRLRWLEDNDSQNWFYQRLSEEELDPLTWVSSGGGLEETLTSFLSRQLNRRRVKAELRQAAEYLIRCLEDDGYLRTPLEELGLPLPRLEEALALLQSLEPAGVGARDLSQCLALQLERIGETGPALAIVRDYLPQLARRQDQAVAQALGIPQAQVEAAWRTIRELDPRPGAVFHREDQVHYAHPDLIVEECGGQLTVRTLRGERPPFRISPYYQDLLAQTRDPEVQAYLTARLEQAEDLLWAVQRREGALLACARFLLARQEEFFRSGPDALVPLAAEEAAPALELDAEDVRQTVREKYLQCAWGVFPLSGFFRL